MKNFLSLFATAFLLSGVLFMSSCTEDDTTIPGGGGGNDTPPTVAISDISNTAVDGGTTITFTVTASSGTNDLSSLTVTEDGVNIGTDRYSIQEYTDNSITLNNPQLLTGNDVNNFVYTVNITVPSENLVPEDDTDYVYDVIVTDDIGESDSDFVTVTVFGVEIVDPGTPTEFELGGVLLNQAGADGGLDLDDGTSTGTVNAPGSEIRDLGIDCTIASPNENWRGLFGTFNGADMRQVDPVTIAEGFSFDNATTVEVIQGAYDVGIQLGDDVSTAPNCDETVVTDVAQPIVGDMYVVSANGRFYLIRVDQINAVSSSNNDNYVFSIKY